MMIKNIIVVCFIFILLGCEDSVARKWHDAIASGDIAEVTVLLDKEKDDKIYSYCRTAIEKKRFEIAGVMLNHLLVIKKNNPDKIFNFVCDFILLQESEYDEIFRPLLINPDFVNYIKKHEKKVITTLNYSLTHFILKKFDFNKTEAFVKLCQFTFSARKATLPTLRRNSSFDEKKYDSTITGLLLYLIDFVELEALKDGDLLLVSAGIDIEPNFSGFQNTKVKAFFERLKTIGANRGLKFHKREIKVVRVDQKRHNKWHNAIASGDIAEIMVLLDKENDDEIYTYCSTAIKEKRFDIAGIMFNHLLVTKKNSPDKIFIFVNNFVLLQDNEYDEMLKLLFESQDFVNYIKEHEKEIIAMSNANHSFTHFMVKRFNFNKTMVFSKLCEFILAGRKATLPFLKIDSSFDEKKYEKTTNDLLLYLVDSVELETLVGVDFLVVILAIDKEPDFSGFQNEKLKALFKKAKEISVERAVKEYEELKAKKGK